MRLWDTTPAGGVLQRGSAHIRRAFGASLANGNYIGVINGVEQTPA